MTELYAEHLEWTEDGLQLDRITDMKERDLRPEVTTCQIVPSDSGHGVYLVAEASVLDKPFDVADIASDRTTVHVCSCSDFYFNQSADIDVDTKPSDMGECKHIRATVKHKRAQNDDNQQAL